MLNPTNKVENLLSKNMSFFNKFILLVALLIILGCSTITKSGQSTTRQIINVDDQNLLKNSSRNNISYIGEDGNVWITDEGRDLKITDFAPESNELPVYSYYWSPDGKKIAVYTNKGIYIYIISAKGIDRHFLGLNSFILGDLLQPWAPDSNKILTTQFGFKSLDLWEITNNGVQETKGLIKPLSLGSHFIWLPDSERFIMSEDWLEEIGPGTLCSGFGTKIRMSIVDTQAQSRDIIYEGWGNTFDIFTDKIIFIGRDNGCEQFPMVYDLKESKLLKFNQAVVKSILCFGDHTDNIAIFTVSSMIDASQSILVFDTDTMFYNNFEFGKISKLTDYKSNCEGYFWSQDKKTLYFNSDVFWGGEIIRVDIQSDSMYPLVGDKKLESQFVFDLPNAQVVDVLDDDNILVSGAQDGQIDALYYVNIQTSQMKRLGDEAFWVTPSYFGQSQGGLLIIQATDIQTQLTNIYWVDTNGSVKRRINNASQPNWQQVE